MYTRGQSCGLQSAAWGDLRGSPGRLELALVCYPSRLPSEAVSRAESGGTGEALLFWDLLLLTCGLGAARCPPSSTAVLCCREGTFGVWVDDCSCVPTLRTAASLESP